MASAWGCIQLELESSSSSSSSEDHSHKTKSMLMLNLPNPTLTDPPTLSFTASPTLLLAPPKNQPPRPSRNLRTNQSMIFQLPAEYTTPMTSPRMEACLILSRTG